MTVKRIVANIAAKEVGSAQAFYGDVLERNCVGVLGRTNTSARLTRSVRRAGGLVLVGNSEAIQKQRCRKRKTRFWASLRVLALLPAFFILQANQQVRFRQELDA